MANNTASEARKIISDIRKGVFSPVYLLMGPESYYIDMIVENIEKYAIPEEDRDFNYSVFYGNDADIDYVVGVAQQFPVMAPRKLVVLKEAQSMVQAKVKLGGSPLISRVPIRRLYSCSPSRATASTLRPSS